MQLFSCRLLCALAFSFSGAAACAATDETPPAAPSVNRLLAAEALNSLASGIHYRFGGTDPAHGLDCSAFVAYLFREALGRTLPRTARQINDIGEQVDLSDIEPGDLVFFGTGKHQVSHVGVYVGGKKFIHASRKHGVVYESGLNEPYWRQRFHGVRRLSATTPQT